MTVENNGTATDTGAPVENGNPAPAPAPKPELGSVPYSRFQEVVEQRKGLESTLTAVIDGMVSELPEEMRDLVPNLPPAEKVAWIRNAQARGLFTTPTAPPANSPDAKRPGGKSHIDLDAMNSMQKLQFGFGKK